MAIARRKGRRREVQKPQVQNRHLRHPLKKRDKRFVPEDHLHVTFGGLLGGVRAVWSKGRLDILPKPLSFANIGQGGTGGVPNVET